MPLSCVVLVPLGSSIDHGCEEGLRELERRGYPVRRVRGYSAIDAARCQMATDALDDGFEELMWIDSDIVFHPDDVERLRNHQLPITCGLYPKKGLRQFANTFHRGMHFVPFGISGGLHDIVYCGFGFTHVRRDVYDRVKRELKLADCNRSFRRNLVPYYAPLEILDENGDPWYLNEDYAFCERARQCGIRIVADTTIRLWHVGSYRYGWEDAGRDPIRVADYTFNITDDPARASRPPAKKADRPTAGFTEDWFTKNIPQWQSLLHVLQDKPCQLLEIGVFEGRSTVWLFQHIATHPESRVTCIDPFTGGREHSADQTTNLESRFLENTKFYHEKINLMKGRSSEMLRSLRADSYDFISIDGSHEAADVLEDAVFSWLLVKAGGLICFDDYEWWIESAPERSPKLAIDTFLSVMRGKYELLHKAWQVWIKKL